MVPSAPASACRDLPLSGSVGRRAAGEAGAESGAGAIECGFEAADLVVAGVEGELAGCVFGGLEAFGAQGDGLDAGALEIEPGEKLASGVGEGRAVGGGFGECPGAAGGGVVGVRDRQGEGVADRVGVAELGSEVLGEADDGSGGVGRGRVRRGRSGGCG